MEGEVRRFYRYYHQTSKAWVVIVFLTIQNNIEVQAKDVDTDRSSDTTLLSESLIIFNVLVYIAVKLL